MDFSKTRFAKAVDGRRCNVCTRKMAVGNSKFISGPRLLQQFVERMLKKLRLRKKDSFGWKKTFFVTART